MTHDPLERAFGERLLQGCTIVVAVLLILGVTGVVTAIHYVVKFW